MATKKSKAAPTDDELNKLLEDLGGDNSTTNVPRKSTTTKASKTAPSQSAQDVLAELENLAAQQPSDRPHTPRIQAAAIKSSPSKRASTETPPPATSARSSEEKASTTRKSVDSTRSFHTSFTPSATSSELQDAEKKPLNSQPAATSGGGWWGGLLATASAAVKTAEAAVKEIQQNEEAKRWAEQVKGNVGALRGLGKLCLRYR